MEEDGGVTVEDVASDSVDVMEPKFKRKPCNSLLHSKSSADASFVRTSLFTLAAGK